MLKNLDKTSSRYLVHCEKDSWHQSEGKFYFSSLKEAIKEMETQKNKGRVCFLYTEHTEITHDLIEEHQPDFKVVHRDFWAMNEVRIIEQFGNLIVQTHNTWKYRPARWVESHDHCAKSVLNSYKQKLQRR